MSVTNNIYLLNEWEGWMGNYLAQRFDIQIKFSEVSVSWLRAKYFPSSLPILICQKAFYHMATNFWNRHQWKYSRVKTFPFFLQIRTRNSILWEAQLFISFSLFWVEVHNFNSCSWQMKKSCLSFHNPFKPYTHHLSLWYSIGL